MHEHSSVSSLRRILVPDSLVLVPLIFSEERATALNKSIAKVGV